MFSMCDSCEIQSELLAMWRWDSVSWRSWMSLLHQNVSRGPLSCVLSSAHFQLNAHFNGMLGSSSVNNNRKETLRNSKSKISSQFHQKARKTMIIPLTAVQMLQRVPQWLQWYNSISNQLPRHSLGRTLKNEPILMHFLFLLGFLRCR